MVAHSVLQVVTNYRNLLFFFTWVEESNELVLTTTLVDRLSRHCMYSLYWIFCLITLFAFHGRKKAIQERHEDEKIITKLSFTLAILLTPPCIILWSRRPCISVDVFLKLLTVYNVHHRFSSFLLEVVDWLGCRRNVLSDLCCDLFAPRLNIWLSPEAPSCSLRLYGGLSVEHWSSVTLQGLVRTAGLGLMTYSQRHILGHVATLSWTCKA